MTPEEWELRKLSVTVPLALAQEYFGFRDADGRMVVPLDMAYVFAAARADLWERWPKVPRHVRELAGRYWRVRPDDLAGRSMFEGIARACAVSGGLYRLPDDVPPREATYLLAAHAQRPLELARELVREAEQYYYSTCRPLPVAGPGKWQFGGPEPSVVTIPDTEEGAHVRPVRLTTAPYAALTTVTRKKILRLARRQAKAGPERHGWKPGLLTSFIDRLQDASGAPVTRLNLPAGKVTVANAPTGVGKSVLMNNLAPLLAARGQGPVAVVVSTIHDGLTNAERIEADDALVFQVAAQLAQATARHKLRCVPLVTETRIAEQAQRAAEQGHEDRHDKLAYGCDLSAWVTDGPKVTRGREPCRALTQVTDPAADTADAESTGPHACPRMAVCGKYALFREAAQADIIVTNHHNLLRGLIQVPVDTGRNVLRQITAMEFVQRHCRQMIVDEVDNLQNSWCSTGAHDFSLATRGINKTSLLVQVDHQRQSLAAAADRRVINALFKARGLGEQFLNYVLDGELWLEQDTQEDERPGSGWHVPGIWDRILIKDLLGLDEHARLDRDTHKAFRAIFPDADNNTAPDPRFKELSGILARAVSRDTDEDELPLLKTEIARALKHLRIPRRRHRDVSNALLVRAWLGCLHQSLTYLKSVIAGLGSQLTAGRELARALGSFTQGGALPYGPLGYQLFGFKVNKNNRGGGELFVQSLGGDPHTGTVQLGGTIALATGGFERSVLALSATAFFPRAACEHLHTEPAYVMTDATPGAVTALAGTVSDSDTAWNPITVGGIDEAYKPERIQELGKRLWQTRLSEHLRQLEIDDHDRARAMVVSNSYKQAALLAIGIASAALQASWIAVVIPKSGIPPGIHLPPGVVTITIDQLEDLPRTHPQVKVICAPLSLVARGLNILVPGTERSALASVWVGLRPVADLHSPAAMYASINATAIAAACPGPDPARMLAIQRRAARRHLHTLLSSDPRFSRLPRYLKTEILAGILVDLIQLAGRARRGGTPVQLYLVDNSLLDTRLGSDFPSLVRSYYAGLTEDEQASLRRVYGSTLTAWLDFAHAPDIPPLSHVPLPRSEDLDHEGV
ncbi:hypothetical protein [Streptomyces lavendulae]|uniref:hypothetical protein n=1 Tax=Streptomyces lavendulae TaxID=1914 RepID=UPI0024A3A8F9|nr:hypothetical protein [Streptomyces lavendulae]GLW02524.1 hypothetical protein Slala05_61540 [Streptomyces lavendulae subsp. lavendulae]